VSTAELGQDLAMALDPVRMMHQAGIVPDPWQLKVLRSRAPRLLLNCCRQSGKSTTTAGLALHTALYEPESLILLLSPGERQSKELLRKVLATYKALDRPIPAEAENKLELELENGSRIVALPGNEGTIRGYSGVQLLIVDEASRVMDDLFQAIKPMLAVSNGRLLALSTPWGQRGWWYEAWEQGGASWDRVEITAYDCPRITAEFLAEEKATTPALWFQSEYLCKFTATVDAVFSLEHIQAAVSSTLAALPDDVIPMARV
jgi:hypothetical protein